MEMFNCMSKTLIFVLYALQKSQNCPKTNSYREQMLHILISDRYWHIPESEEKLNEQMNAGQIIAFSKSRR